jgi:RNA polymerase sigma-70 factor (ECF subfamily)
MQPASPLGKSQIPGFESGDLESLEALARRLAPANVDAQDLAQDARIAAWQSREATRAPKAWLRSVLRRRAIDRLRSNDRRRHREHVIALTPRPDPLDPEHTTLLHERLRALEGALERLDPVDRRLVVGRYYEERTAAELAKELGLVPSTVRTRSQRALARLRRELGDEPVSLGSWMFAPIGLRPARLFRPGIASIVMSKTAAFLTTTAIVLAIAGIWFGTRSSESAPRKAPISQGTAAPVDDASRREAPLARRGAVDRTPQPRSDSAPREVVREQLRELRAETRDELPVSVANADARAFLEQIMATNRQMAEQLAIIHDCFAVEDEIAPGALVVEGDLVGEVGIGMVVDDVSITEDSIGNDDLGECVRQSVLAMQLDTPSQPFYHRYRLTFDTEEGMQHIEAVPTPEQITELVSRFPDIAEGPYASLVDDEPDGVAHAPLLFGD